VPDDEEVGHTGNGVPAPLLRRALVAKGGKQAGEHHDEVGTDGHERVCAIQASQQAKIKQEQRCGDGPVDIAGPVDGPAHDVVRVRHLAVLVARPRAVVLGPVARGHGKVRQRRHDSDARRDDVVEAPRRRHVPRQQREAGRREHHDGEDDPERPEACLAGVLELGRRSCGVCG